MLVGAFITEKALYIDIKIVKHCSWFITRYSEKDTDGDWYLDPKNRLLLDGGSELSEVGKLYNSL